MVLLLMMMKMMVQNRAHKIVEPTLHRWHGVEDKYTMLLLLLLMLMEMMVHACTGVGTGTRE